MVSKAALRSHRILVLGHWTARIRGPQLGSQIGPSEDMFEVYLGGIDYPLDASPIWRFYCQGFAGGTAVDAVEQFRKAIEDSEKQQQKP